MKGFHVLSIDGFEGAYMSFVFALMLSLFGSQPLVAAESGCNERHLVYREGGFEVSATRIEPARKSDRMVVILPPTGGTNFMDISYGRAFCRANISALLINQWSNDQEYSLDLEIHDRFYRRGQRAIDLVIARSKEAQIGLLGTSVGAEHAAIASRRNERIGAVFLIVGGAPIASILATSDQEILADGKAKRFKMFGYRSLRDYEAALEAVIPFEPLKMAMPRRKPRLGMVVSLNDGTVPTEFQLRLRDAWMPSTLIYSGLGHVGTILNTWFCHQKRITDFFVTALSMPRPMAE